KLSPTTVAGARRVARHTAPASSANCATLIAARSWGARWPPWPRYSHDTTGRRAAQWGVKNIHWCTDDTRPWTVSIGVPVAAPATRYARASPSWAVATADPIVTAPIVANVSSKGDRIWMSDASTARGRVR